MQSRRSCAWLVSGVSGFRVPFAPKGESTFLGFRPLRHMQAREIRLSRRLHASGIVRPQGLATLSAVFSLASRTTIRRSPQRPWGSPFRALLLPASGTLLRASPLLSFHRVDFRRNGRDSRGCLRPGKGTESLHSKAVAAEPCPPGFCPSKAFSSVAPKPASWLQPLLPFRPKVLPTFPLPGEAPGDLHATKAAGLSQDCRPSWGFAPCRTRAPLRELSTPGLWLRLSR